MSAEARPEPALRVPAVEDFSMIAARLRQLQEVGELPKPPQKESSD